MSFMNELRDVSFGQWAAVAWFFTGLLLLLAGSPGVHKFGLAMLLLPLWWQTYFIIKPRMVVRDW